MWGGEIMAGGRPTNYTPKLVSRVCERIAAGDSLRTICKDDDMPGLATIFLWLGKHPKFVEQYTIAKQQQMDAFSEEILDIADNSTNDWMAANDPENPGYKMNGEAINRARLRVDTRKWLMSKLVPKKYGDKQEIHHTMSLEDLVSGE